MKGLLSLIVVGIMCVSISSTVSAQEQSGAATQTVAQDCDDCCRNCQPVRNAVGAVLQVPKKVACAWQSRKPVRTMVCRWRKARPIRSMFTGCGCN